TPTFHLDVDMGPANIVMFTSGWGDGFYASWFGYDAQGRVAALVTDFAVVDWAKAKWEALSLGCDFDPGAPLNLPQPLHPINGAAASEAPMTTMNGTIARTDIS